MRDKAPLVSDKPLTPAEVLQVSISLRSLYFGASNGFTIQLSLLAPVCFTWPANLGGVWHAAALFDKKTENNSESVMWLVWDIQTSSWTQEPAPQNWTELLMLMRGSLKIADKFRPLTVTGAFLNTQGILNFFSPTVFLYLLEKHPTFSL